VHRHVEPRRHYRAFTVEPGIGSSEEIEKRVPSAFG
jgi:hypothetical protein